MAKSFAILTRDQATARIALIGKRGNALTNDIQSIAVTAIGYANVHGDVTIAQDIYTTLSTLGGVRLNSFVKYLEVYGQLAYDKDTKNFVYFKRDNVETDPVALLAQLKDTRWFDAIKQEQPVSEYDVAEMVRKMVANLTKKAGKDGVTIKHAEMLDELSALANQYEFGLDDDAI